MLARSSSTSKASPSKATSVVEAHLTGLKEERWFYGPSFQRLGVSSKFHFQRCTGVVMDVGDGRAHRRSGGWTASALRWGQVALSLSAQLPFALQIDVLHSPLYVWKRRNSFDLFGTAGFFVFFLTTHANCSCRDCGLRTVYSAVTAEKGKDTLSRISMCKGRRGHPRVPFHQLLGILGMSVKGVLI